MVDSSIVGRAGIMQLARVEEKPSEGFSDREFTVNN